MSPDNKKIPTQEDVKQGHPGTDATDTCIGLHDFASLAMIGPRAARLTCSGSQDGKSWRGAFLRVRRVQGRGGIQYEVELDSLPVEMRARWKSIQRAANPATQITAGAEELREELRSKKRQNRPRFVNAPWAQEEREAKHAEFSRLPTPTQEKAKRRLTAVRYFHSLAGAVQSEMDRYEITAREARKSASAIRNWVGACNGLDPGDWLVALAPKPAGYRPFTLITPDAWEYIKGEYFKLTKPALKQIVRRVKKLATDQGWVIPSYSTIKRLIAAEPHSLHVLMREGEEAFELLYPTQRRDYSEIELHQMWCCDARIADLFCRRANGTVYRPIVITWIDVRSRVVLSYVIVDTENAESVRLAFKAAAEKCHAIPESVLLDNSRAFASKMLSGGAPNRFRFKVREGELPGIFTLLGIRINWATPFKGRSKPIESFHRNYAEAEKRCDGAYCGNKPDARPEDCDPSKAIPIEQYRKLIDETIAEYHSRPHRGDSMNNRSPREIYDMLLPQSTPRQPTREQLRLCLLAAENIRLAPDSGAVRLLGNRYWCETLAELPRGRDYCVRFNPDDLTEPVSVYDGEKFICEAPIQTRTGFRDSAAAKTHARARGHFLKGLKQQHAATREMSKARAWNPSPNVPDPLLAEVAEAVLPTPKVVTPLRPERDYRLEQLKEPVISRDDFLELILNHKPRQAQER